MRTDETGKFQSHDKKSRRILRCTGFLNRMKRVCTQPRFSGGSVTFTSSPLLPGKLVNITSIRFGTR